MNKTITCTLALRNYSKMAFGVVSSKNGNRRPRESGFMFMIRLFIVAVLFRARFPYFWLKLSLLVTLTRENKSFCSSNLLPGKMLFCIMYFSPTRCLCSDFKFNCTDFWFLYSYSITQTTKLRALWIF